MNAFSHNIYIRLDATVINLAQDLAGMTVALTVENIHLHRRRVRVCVSLKWRTLGVVRV
jgi:hypothetical protein